MYEGLYVKNQVSFDGIIGDQLELEISVAVNNATDLCIRLLSSGDEYATVEYDGETGQVAFDRNNTGTKISGLEKHDINRREVQIPEEKGELNLRIFIDKSTVEIFINEGLCVMSSTVFPKKNGKGIQFVSRNGCKLEKLIKWDLVI